MKVLFIVWVLVQGNTAYVKWNYSVYGNAVSRIVPGSESSLFDFFFNMQGKEQYFVSLIMHTSDNAMQSHACKIMIASINFCRCCGSVFFGLKTFKPV